MLIDFPRGAVQVDRLDFVENVRINVIPKDKQARIKFTICDKKMPVDLVIYNWSNPKLDMANISVDIVGEELTNELEFTLRATISLFSKNMKISGTFCDKQISFTCSNIPDVMKCVVQLLKNATR